MTPRKASRKPILRSDIDMLRDDRTLRRQSARRHIADLESIDTTGFLECFSELRSCGFTHFDHNWVMAIIDELIDEFGHRGEEQKVGTAWVHRRLNPVLVLVRTRYRLELAEAEMAPPPPTDTGKGRQAILDAVDALRARSG